MDSAVFAEGTLSLRENEAPKILVRSVKSLESATISKPVAQVNAADSLPQSGKLYLRVNSLSDERWKQAEAIIEIFSGKDHVVIYEKESGKYSAISNKGVTADRFVIGELKELLGD